MGWAAPQLREMLGHRRLTRAFTLRSLSLACPAGHPLRPPVGGLRGVVNAWNVRRQPSFREDLGGMDLLRWWRRRRDFRPAEAAHVYEFRGRFVVPTVARTEAGFWLEIEPVAVLACNLGALASALDSAREHGNPQIPTPKRSEYGPPVVCTEVGVRGWRAFEAEAQFWRLEWRPSGVTIAGSKRAPDGGFEDDTDTTESLAPEVSCAVLAEHICAAASKKGSE